MDSCFMVDWLRCLTSCELWLKFLPIYRPFLRSFPQVLVHPLGVTNVTPHIMALVVLQITIDLCQDCLKRGFTNFWPNTFMQKHNCFSDLPSPRVTAEKKVQKLLEAPAQIHMALLLAFFFLNNCALFILNHLLLSSSLCFSFPPHYDFHLQIIVPLSTQNLLWTENIMHSVFFLLLWTSWVTSLSYPIEVFLTGWNNFYFSFLYFRKIFPNTDIMIWWRAYMPYCFSVFFPKIWAGPINKNASLATNLSHILRSL